MTDNSKNYHVNLETISLDQLKETLRTANLLPSQQILLDQFDERFDTLQDQGIHNLLQLQTELKNKKKLIDFSEKSGLPVNYLTVLRREVNSYQPKPINLRDFPGLNPETVHKLEKAGIKHTAHLFPHVLTPQSRQAFAEEHGLPGDELLELTKLTDVARTKWVGPIFARLLIESEYDTVEKIAGCDYVKLHSALTRINREKNLYRGGFGLEDLKSWVTIVVPFTPPVIEYE